MFPVLQMSGVVKFVLLFCVSLLFGNLIVYYLFAGETYITAQTRTVLFIILTAAGIAGVLLMILFRQRRNSEADAT